MLSHTYRKTWPIVSNIETRSDSMSRSRPCEIAFGSGKPRWTNCGTPPRFVACPRSYGPTWRLSRDERPTSKSGRFRAAAVDEHCSATKGSFRSGADPLRFGTAALPAVPNTPLRPIRVEGGNAVSNLERANPPADARSGPLGTRFSFAD